MGKEKKGSKKDGRRTRLEKLAEALVNTDNITDNIKVWGPFLVSLGLSKEAGERLTRLLVLHLLLDRSITALITAKFVGAPRPTAFLQVEAKVAKVPIAQRINLLEAAGFISDSCADNLFKVNDARNDLAHYQPTLGFELSKVKHLSSDEAFKEYLLNALCAMEELEQKVHKSMSDIWEPLASPLLAKHGKQGGGPFVSSVP